MKMSSSNVFVCLLIVQAALLPCRATPGKIIVAPEPQTVPVGTLASFNCTAEGHEAVWVVNGSDCRTGCLSQRGFTIREDTPPTGSGMWVLYMDVLASIENNNTNIRCKAHKDQITISDPAYLVVMGPPSPPHLVLQPLNETTLYFNIEAPFTWSQYPVLYYTIIGVPGIDPQTIPVDENATGYSTVMHSKDIPFELRQCTEITVTTTASSELGESEPTAVRGGFPMAPDPFTAVTCDVLFQSDGSPQATIEFELPRMCPYQNLNYTITAQLNNNATADSVVFGPKHHVYGSGGTISEALESGLVVGEMYSVTVTVENLVGSSSSDSIVCDTTFTPTTPPSTTMNSSTPMVPTVNSATPMVPDVSSTSISVQVTNSPREESEGDELLMIIIIAASAGGCLTLFILVLVTCCIFICYWRFQRQKSQDMKVRSMVPNPIYEGPLYETIGQPFSTLSSNCETRESRYQDNPMYPPTKEGMRDYRISVDEKLAPVYGQTLVEDNYTVMSPARVEGGSLTKEDLGTVMSPARVEGGSLTKEDLDTVMSPARVEGGSLTKEDLGMLKANDVCA